MAGPELNLRNHININATRRQVERLFPRCIDRGLEILAREAASRTPRDTGRLVASQYTNRTSPTKGVIGYDADYAVFVHEDMTDTHNDGGPKYLERTIKHPMVRAEVRRAIIDVLEAAI